MSYMYSDCMRAVKRISVGLFTVLMEIYLSIRVHYREWSTQRNAIKVVMHTMYIFSYCYLYDLGRHTISAPLHYPVTKNTDKFTKTASVKHGIYKIACFRFKVCYCTSDTQWSIHFNCRAAFYHQLKLENREGLMLSTE